MFAYLYILKLLAANNFTFQPIKSKEKVALFKLLYVEARRAALSLILDSSDKYFFPLFHSDQSQLEIFYSFLFRTKSSEFEIDRKKIWASARVFGIREEEKKSGRRRNRRSGRPGLEPERSSLGIHSWLLCRHFYIIRHAVNAKRGQSSLPYLLSML